MKCTKCNEDKPKDSFCSGSTWCKECRTQYQSGRRSDKKFDPLELLYRSCERAVGRGRHTKGTYKNIRCYWKSPKDMQLALMHSSVFWTDWVAQTAIYAETGDKGERPTLDRIDEKGHYSLDNIQCMSHRNNVLKANQQEVDALNMETWSLRTFPSKKHARQELGTLKMLDKGIAFSPDKVPFIVQSAIITNDRSRLRTAEQRESDKRQAMLNMAMVCNNTVLV